MKYFPLYFSQNYSRICVTSCPSGYYAKTNGLLTTCEVCPVENCTECSSSNPNNCVKCSLGNYLDNTSYVCLNSVPIGYYFISHADNIISKCNISLNSCDICLNQTYCAQCSSNYYLFPNNTCNRCAIENCSNCQLNPKQCTQCNDGKLLDIVNFGCYNTLPNNYYYYNQIGGLIKPCNIAINNCNQCNNESFCINCSNGSYLYLYTNFSQLCLNQCPSGYYPNQILNICEACNINNCINCTSDANKCSQCLNDFEDGRCLVLPTHLKS